MDAPRVTAIVPTRDRPESLKRTLDALGRQSLGDSLEVLVVQDGGRDVLGPLVAGSPHARLIRQDAAGPGAARNRGAGEARAAAFSASPTTTASRQSDWAERLEAALADADAAVGATVNADPNSRVSVASQLVVTHLTEWSSKSHAYGPASNFAARRDVFLEVPFDSARFTFAGGDRDWCDRIHRSGKEAGVRPRRDRAAPPTAHAARVRAPAVRVRARLVSLPIPTRRLGALRAAVVLREPGRARLCVGSGRRAAHPRRAAGERRSGTGAKPLEAARPTLRRGAARRPRPRRRHRRS